MSEEAQKQLQLENLILKLNNNADQRQDILDTLWELERQSKAMRFELMQLMNRACVEAKRGRHA